MEEKKAKLTFGMLNPGEKFRIKGKKRLLMKTDQGYADMMNGDHVWGSPWDAKNLEVEYAKGSWVEEE